MIGGRIEGEQEKNTSLEIQLGIYKMLIANGACTAATH